MKVLTIEQRTDEWYEARKGKITGSKLHDIVVKRGTGKKMGFYELLADRLAVPKTVDETDIERGIRLEEEALQKLSAVLDRPFKKAGLCVSDDNPNIAYSPDGLIEDVDTPEKFEATVEMKCPDAPRYLKSLIEQEIPSEYREQMIQSFIVNTDQKYHIFAFYNPLVTVKPIFYIRTNREDVKEEIDALKAYQIKELEEIDQLLEKIAF